MKTKSIISIIIVALFITSCTASRRAKMLSYNPGEVTCYSGGKIIYHGFSTGYIHNEESSDGYYFQEKGTNNLIRLSGQCVIRQN